MVINPLFGQDYLRIIKSGVNIRFGPSSSSRIITQAKNGNIFELTEEKGDWYGIIMFSGEYRYIPKSMCEKIKYNLSLPQDIQLRKKVFNSILTVEDKAQVDEDAKFPPSDINKNIEYNRILNDKYKLDIINKFNLQPPIYSKLISEGAKNRWDL